MNDVAVPLARASASRISSLALGVIFIGAAVSSNWVLQHFGRYNGPGAPRTIPIGLGMHAASGVLLVGVMISVRDALHERVGLCGTLIAVVAGSAASALLAPPALAIASGLTMLMAESGDALIYQRLRRRGLLIAGTASNLVSAFLDSVVFLLVAYGVRAAVHETYPLTVGKIEASLITLVALALVSRTIRPRATCPSPDEAQHIASS